MLDVTSFPMWLLAANLLSALTIWRVLPRGIPLVVPSYSRLRDVSQATTLTKLLTRAKMSRWMLSDSEQCL